MNTKTTDCCTTCRKETEYTLQKRIILRTINQVTHAFHITVAICNQCSNEMSPHGLIDKNIHEIKEQMQKNVNQE